MRECSTVLIGEQCWFADNLNTEFYSNADPIDKDLDNTEWISTDQGAVASFGVGEEYKGMLYNWYAIDDDRNICPNGWRVSSDDDWIEMELFIGNPEVQGIQLKSDPNDVYPWNGTNARNFNGVPCGIRAGESGILYSDVDNERFWVTHEEYLTSYMLSSTNDGVARILSSTTNPVSRRHGRSVRCIKD
ncbi:MAG TPA: hypothetical protein DGP89_07030 [Saprospirales bacterium]|nr:hypothetical protein [Saprospirales bacterium]